MTETIGNIRMLAAKIAKSWDTVTVALLELKTDDGVGFELSVSIPDLDHSLFELQMRLAGTFGLLKGLPANADFSVVPDAFINDLFNHLDNARSTLDQIVQFVIEINTSEGAEEIDKDALFVVLRGSDQARKEFGPLFKQMWVHSEHLLNFYYRIIPATGGESFADFSGLSAGFGARMKEIEVSAETMRNLGDEATDTKKKIDAIEEQLSGHESEAARIKEEGANDRKSISEYLGEVTQKQAEINGIHTAAVSLKEQVASYEGQFDAFQKQLDAREENILNGQKNLDDLIGRIQLRQIELVQQEAVVQNLIVNGETMLEVTTDAGLAGAFSKRVTILDGELEKARTYFGFAIGTLFVSALPLAFHIFPGFSALIGLADADTAQQTAGQFAASASARMAIMLPAVWLTMFAGGRHARLFRLREQYAHKFSIAASVDGFKKQAEGYEGAIAAETYMRLAAINPAERMEPRHAATDDGSHGPIMAMLKPIRDFWFRKTSGSEE